MEDKGYISMRHETRSSGCSSFSSAALQHGVRFGLLYKVVPLLSISSQLLPVLHLEYLHIFEDSIDPSILGSSCWAFFQMVSCWLVF